MSFVFNSYAQVDNLSCAIDDESYLPIINGAYSGSADPSLLDQYDPIVVNVKFWGINKPNGATDFLNRKEESLQAIANLNIAFNPYKIYFKFVGFEQFNSPIHYWDMDGDGDLDADTNGFYVLEETYAHIGDLETWASANGKKDPSAINVYLFGWGHGFAGWGRYPDKFTMGVKSGGITDPLMLHEMGHVLNLRHTWSNNEKVSREPFLPNGDVNPDFNARTAGDAVEDTAAIGEFWHDGTYPYLLNCEYQSGFEFDSSTPPQPYVPTPDDVANILSDAYPCVDFKVTVGQGIRAQESLATGNYAAAIGTIASLYEPYQGEYYTGGPLQDPADLPLFQPGFEYRFIECECDCDEPSPYEDTSFYYSQNIIKTIDKDESDFTTIFHPNHTAIGIKVLNEPIFWPQPRRCFDNGNKKPSSGMVTKFNDGVFNANVTMTPRDSIAINDPNLVHELPDGLYAIDMAYPDGSNEQIVVQKGNNN